MTQQQKEFCKILIKDFGYNDSNIRHWVKKAKEIVK